MTIRWVEGFDQYGGAGNEALPLEGLWGAFQWSLDATKARTGTASAKAPAGNGSSRRTLGRDCTTVGVGFGFWMDALPVTPAHSTPLVQVRDVNLVNQIHLSMGTTGRLQVYCGGFDGGANSPVLLGSSTKEMATGTWNHIELKTVLDGSAGVVEVYVNGVQWINVSGADTVAVGSTGFGSQVVFGISGGGCFSSNLWWDDIFTYDEQTGGVHDILGQYGVYTLMPNADTATADWQLSTGSSGFALINEIPPDDDVKFLFTSLTAKESDFNVQALPANIVAVAAVQPTARMRKTDTGDCSVQVGVQRGGDLSLHTTFPLTTAYSHYFNVDEVDPDGSGAWNPVLLPAVVVKRTN